MERVHYLRPAFILVPAFISTLASPARAFTSSDGVTFSCITDHGVQVVDYNSMDPRFLASGFAAYATVENGRPVILVNADMVVTIPVAAQKFLFWHECAHHNGAAFGPTKEVDANCIAMRYMREHGLLTSLEEHGLERFIRALPSVPPLYPDGNTQWTLMNQCGATPTPARAPARSGVRSGHRGSGTRESLLRLPP